MAKALLVGGRNNQAITLGNFATFGSAPGSVTYNVKSKAAKPARIAGSISDLSVKVDANGTSRHIKLRKNSADSALDVNPTDSTAGTFTDTDSVSFSATDTYNLQFTGTAPAFIVYWARAIWQAASGHSTFLASAVSVYSSDRYSSFGAGASSTVKSAVKTKLKGSGTISNSAALVATASGSTVTCRLRKNGADANATIVIASGLTGVFEDTSNTDTFVNNDDLNWNVTGVSGSPTIQTISSVSYDTLQNDLFFLPLSGITANASAQFLCPGGSSLATLTETEVELDHGFPVTVSKLRCNVTVNSMSATTTLSLRKNNANGNNALTVPAGTTGQFESSDGLLDVYSPTDKMAVSVTGGTSGSISFGHVGVTEQPNQVSLSASLFANSQTYFTQILTPGAATLTAQRHANSNSLAFQHAITTTRTLTAATFTASPGFFTHVVQTGAVSLVPSLFSNLPDTFQTQTVTPGSITLVPQLFNDTPDTIYFPINIGQGLLIDWQKFNNSNTFNTHALTVGGITVTVAKFTNDPTFFTHVLQGQQVLTASLFVDGDSFNSVSLTMMLYAETFTGQSTFYQHAFSFGVSTLSPDKLDNINVFSGHVLTASGSMAPALFVNDSAFYPVHLFVSVQVTAALFQNSNTFYDQEVIDLSGTQHIAPSVFLNDQTFYVPIFQLSAINITLSLFANGQAFFGHSITLSKFDQALTAALFENSSTFRLHSVSTGIRMPAPRRASSVRETRPTPRDARNNNARTTRRA